MTCKDNPPYTLFQSPEGFWGTKDKDRNVKDNPVYVRSTVPGNENIFHDIAGLEVVSFDVNEGMSVIVWCSESWYDTAWSAAKYPKEFDNILWDNINSHREFTSDDCRVLEKIRQNFQLTGKQNKVLSLLDLFFKWEETDIMDPQFDEIEQKLQAMTPHEYTRDEIMESILPFMHSTDLLNEDKSILWYGIFRLNDYLLYN